MKIEHVSLDVVLKDLLLTYSGKCDNFIPFVRKRDEKIYIDQFAFQLYGSGKLDASLHSFRDVKNLAFKVAKDNRLDAVSCLLSANNEVITFYKSLPATTRARGITYDTSFSVSQLKNAPSYITKFYEEVKEASEPQKFALKEVVDEVEILGDAARFGKIMYPTDSFYVSNSLCSIVRIDPLPPEINGYLNDNNIRGLLMNTSWSISAAAAYCTGIAHIHLLNENLHLDLDNRLPNLLGMRGKFSSFNALFVGCIERKPGVEPLMYIEKSLLSKLKVYEPLLNEAIDYFRDLITVNGKEGYEKKYPLLFKKVFPDESRLVANNIVLDSKLLVLAFDAYKHFWQDYNKHRLPKKENIVSWIEENWPSGKPSSKKASEAICIIIRPDDAPNRSVSKNK